VEVGRSVGEVSNLPSLFLLYGYICRCFVFLWNFYSPILSFTHGRFQDVDASAFPTRGPGRPRERGVPSTVSLPPPSTASQSAPHLPTVNLYGIVWSFMEFSALDSLFYGTFI
jgi:hypothetical protein